MKRLFSSILVGLACVMGATTGVFAQTQSPEVTPSTLDSRSITTTLTVYLDAFNIGDLRKAYSMFADIKQQMSLKQWEALGDPQKGWRPILTRVHVVEKQNAAMVYTVSTILPPNATHRRNFIFVYPMIKHKEAWKMVSDEADFGHQTSLIFKQLTKKIEAYAEKQHVSLN